MLSLVTNPENYLRYLNLLTKPHSLQERTMLDLISLIEEFFPRTKKASQFLQKESFCSRENLTL